jgi:hypothetical protein
MDRCPATWCDDNDGGDDDNWKGVLRNQGYGQPMISD